ncbi:MAG: basic amino acid ABC transporter substrate-binding protein [Lachnospiraceae bacterium]|nr:basic amino acid ABC transporter substrate-binding protein [Lachnospiraceae bacterium]MBR4574746.1 basic amino acid ABC transporter substrate-binding protein [Lachnospiraceae bacterium]
MIMKRSMITVLAVCAAFVLSACGSGSSNKLVMATNAAFPPYEYVEGSEITGIDPEIAKLIADDLGKELVIEDMAFDSIIAAVQSGKADIAMAGMTVTEDRKQNINFSDPYTEAAQVIVVKNDSTVASPDDLKGKTIGVQIGTTGDIYAEDIEEATIERYSKYFEAINALTQGKIDAVIVDREPGKVFVGENADLKMIDEEFTVEEYAIGVAKDNEQLLNDINASLKKLQDSGKIDEIINKYIKAE